MRICYFGTYRAEYSRNRILIEGLRRNGVEVIECHEQLWSGIGDRVESVQGGWKRPAFWWRVAKVYARLVSRYWRLGGRYDVLLVGYPGQMDIFLARLLAWLHRKPLVWDVFMSIYLIALERGLDRVSPRGVTLLRWLERMACRLPDLLVLDTAAYAAWFERTHRVPAARFWLVPTGADERLFTPRIPTPRQSDACFTVLYYGTFIPNHGVQTIIEAASLLANDPTIRFQMIGDGPERTAAVSLARARGLGNVTFVEWLEGDALHKYIADADLCLGVFGTTPQSLMTVQNKLYECLAMGKPVISGAGAAVNAQFQHGTHLYFVPRADPQALTDGIRHLQKEPELRARLGQEGRRIFLEEFALVPLGRRLLDGLSRL